MTSSTDHAKKLATLLRDDLAAAGIGISHSLALELVAHQLGARNWNVLAAAPGRPARSGRPEISPGVPVLRVMSVARALPFYVDYLGFRLDWEHRFDVGSCTCPSTTATAARTVWCGFRSRTWPVSTGSCSGGRTS